MTSKLISVSAPLTAAPFTAAPLSSVSVLPTEASGPLFEGRSGRLYSEWEHVTDVLDIWTLDLQASKQARKDQQKRYEMHRTLSQGLGEEWIGRRMPDGRPIPQVADNARAGRLLWALRGSRLTLQLPRSMGYRLEALAEKHPDWARVHAHAVLRPEAALAPYEGRVMRLTSSFSAQRRGQRGQRGVERDVIDQWLARKTAAFELLRINDLSLELRREPRQGGIVPLPVHTLDAHIRVNDPRELALLLRSGLGRAHGFGVGLVRLSPV